MKETTRLTKLIQKNTVQIQIKLGILAMLCLFPFMNFPSYSIYRSLVFSVFKRFKLINDTRGTLEAVKDMKLSRLAFTRWMCNKPFIKEPLGVPLAKDGLPKVLPSEVRTLLKTSDNKWIIKTVLSILNFSRIVKGGTPLSLKTITDKSESRERITNTEIILALRKLTPLALPRPKFDNSNSLFKWVATSGPNGISIGTSLSDLPKFIIEFASESKVLAPQIWPKINKILEWQEKVNLLEIFKDSGKAKTLRKLSIKDDKEGKSRPFAIFDYWSQTTLTPLHDLLFSILRKIPNDCTFDQTRNMEYIKSVSSRKWFYSYDLTSATDRFPVLFQERVLALLIDKEYASAWSSIMTKLPFSLKGEDQPVSFGAGQPLGAKSSWAMFTLCHHVVVHIAAARAKATADYMLLGDDIVIRGSALALSYKRIMNELGVSISETKSHVSKDTFEFAKIWYHKTINVSGFPLSGFIDVLDKPLELASLIIFELPRKGFDLQICPSSLTGMLYQLLPLYTDRPRLALWKANQVGQCIAILEYLRSWKPEWAAFLLQQWSVNLSRLTADVFLSEMIRQAWFNLVKQGLEDIKAYAWSLAKKIPSSLAFIDSDDDDLMIVGSNTPNRLQLADHLLNLPIFSGLTNESDIDYEALISDNDAVLKSLDVKAIGPLKLPPKPQLKGLSPIRTKASVRAVVKIFKTIKVMCINRNSVTTAKSLGKSTKPARS